MSAPPHRPPRPPHSLHDVFLAIQSLLVLIVSAVFIVTFIAQPFQIPSGSMEPSLRIGDFLLVDKQLVPSNRTLLPSTRIRRGDIVVFHFPVDPAIYLVKRVIAIPGDRIRLRGGRVFRNGQLQSEPYAVYRESPSDNFRDNFPSMQTAEPGIDTRWWIEMRSRIDHGELIVPPGRFFVLGDNRNDSEDSRYWGFVPEAAIVGKPWLIYFSLRQRERGNRLAQTGDPANDSANEQANEQPATPSSAPTSALEERLLDRLAAIARWDRTLTVVR